MGSIIWLFASWGCAVLFLGIGIYTLRAKTPMNFWSGKIVKNEDVIDISAYNKENGIMWSTYSIVYWIDGITGMFNELVGGIIMFSACSIGLLLLIFNYRRIEKKYLKKYQ